ncbi:MAG TPA: uroporphyrinogen decarboxylase [Alphaproteobacteria bacterium]|nr:uroporphyrinogen decarboxylase [Alphaproteobacteria bacterium]
MPLNTNQKIQEIIKTMTGKLAHTLQGKTFDTPPIWLMRQAGRYLPEYLATRSTAGNFLNLCYTPTLASEVTLQPIRRFNFDAAILFSDILVIPHAMGQHLEFAANHGPILGELPDLDTIDLSKFHVNLSPVYETVSIIRKQLNNEGFSSTDLIGFSGAPWTLACYMIDRKGTKDFNETRTMALSQPEIFSKLIDLLTQAATEYLTQQILHGANIIQIFDSWAGVLPPDQFRKWVIAPTKKIITNLHHQFPHIPVIGFPKGASFLYAEYARETAVTCLGLDTQVPPEYAAKNLQTICPVQGNLDPMTLKAGGKELKHQILKIIENFKGKPYVFNLGHGIDKDTPPAHIKQLIKIIKESGINHD